jgi:hypothetical protein
MTPRPIRTHQQGGGRLFGQVEAQLPAHLECAQDFEVVPRADPLPIV